MMVRFLDAVVVAVGALLIKTADATVACGWAADVVHATPENAFQYDDASKQALIGGTMFGTEGVLTNVPCGEIFDLPSGKRAFCPNVQDCYDDLDAGYPDHADAQEIAFKNGTPELLGTSTNGWAPACGVIINVDSFNLDMETMHFNGVDEFCDGAVSEYIGLTNWHTDAWDEISATKYSGMQGNYWGTFKFHTAPKLQSIQMLDAVHTTAPQVYGCPELTEVRMDSLQHFIGGSVQNNPKLVVLEWPELITYDNFMVDGAILELIAFPKLRMMKSGFIGGHNDADSPLSLVVFGNFPYEWEGNCDLPVTVDLLGTCHIFFGLSDFKQRKDTNMGDSSIIWSGPAASAETMRANWEKNKHKAHFDKYRCDDVMQIADADGELRPILMNVRVVGISGYFEADLTQAPEPWDLTDPAQKFCDLQAAAAAAAAAENCSPGRRLRRLLFGGPHNAAC